MKRLQNKMALEGSHVQQWRRPGYPSIDHLLETFLGQRQNLDQGTSQSKENSFRDLAVSPKQPHFSQLGESALKERTLDPV